MYYYRISQCRLPIGHTDEDLLSEIRRLSGFKHADRAVAGNLNVISPGVTFEIVRRSLDARKKEELYYSYVIDLVSEKPIRLSKNTKLEQTDGKKEYSFCPAPDAAKRFRHRPVVVGMGPAGLFCAYELAKAGCAPILVERGDAVERRREKVNRFWAENRLDPESNVQFGEGGAGTFSDGKLNTLVKDRTFRAREVLKTFVRFGAPADILYESKPHIGTDLLADIVKNMREEILGLGGTVYFRTKLKNIVTAEDGSLVEIVLEQEGQPFALACDALVLATGHSARDTFDMLARRGVQMEAKPFAVGVRVQHPQRMISVCQYGEHGAKLLPPADYKLTGKTSDGRGVYTFCMCPGGYVVNASSEPGHLAVNGMSYHDRASASANSALIVQVTPEDFIRYTAGSSLQDVPAVRKADDITSAAGTPYSSAADPLAGIHFQRSLESAMYRLAGGRIPVQLYGDFRSHKNSVSFGDVVPCFQGETQFARLDEALLPFLSRGITEGMEQFAKKIPEFDRRDAILAGIESRTSSPVRILRGDDLQSVSLPGLYPCGEGAGYAGGIMSAAMDGIRVYEAMTG